MCPPPRARPSDPILSKNNTKHNDCAKANAADTMKNGRAHLLYTNKGVCTSMLCIQASLRFVLKAYAV